MLVLGKEQKMCKQTEAKEELVVYTDYQPAAQAWQQPQRASLQAQPNLCRLA